MACVFAHAALALGLRLGVPAASPAAVIVTFDLQPTGVTTRTATFDVLLTFPDAPGDTIEALQLGITGSDPALTADGTNFGRFSFALNPATLPGWAELVPLSGGASASTPLWTPSTGRSWGPLARRYPSAP
jgi:hypothetical protein